MSTPAVIIASYDEDILHHQKQQQLHPPTRSSAHRSSDDRVAVAVAAATKTTDPTPATKTASSLTTRLRGLLHQLGGGNFSSAHSLPAHGSHSPSLCSFADGDDEHDDDNGNSLVATMSTAVESRAARVGHTVAVKPDKHPISTTTTTTTTTTMASASVGFLDKITSSLSGQRRRSRSAQNWHRRLHQYSHRHNNHRQCQQQQQQQQHQQHQKRSIMTRKMLPLIVHRRNGMHNFHMTSSSTTTTAAFDDQQSSTATAATLTGTSGKFRSTNRRSRSKSQARTATIVAV